MHFNMVILLFLGTKSTSADRMVIAPNQNSENSNGYIYFYNLNNSSKYSFYTVQTTNLSGGNFFFFLVAEFYHKQAQLMVLGFF